MFVETTLENETLTGIIISSDFKGLENPNTLLTFLLDRGKLEGSSKFRFQLLHFYQIPYVSLSVLHVTHSCQYCEGYRRS